MEGLKEKSNPEMENKESSMYSDWGNAHAVCMSNCLHVGRAEIIGDEEHESLFQSSWHMVGDP